MNLEYGRKKLRSLNNNRRGKNKVGRTKVRKYNKYKKRIRNINLLLSNLKLKKE